MLRGEWNKERDRERTKGALLPTSHRALLQLRTALFLKLFSEQVANNNSREKKNKTLLGAQLFGFVEMMPQLK